METKTIKTVQSITDNENLAKLSEGKAYIKWLRNKFKETPLLEIDVDAEYELFLQDHPEYK